MPVPVFSFCLVISLLSRTLTPKIVSIALLVAYLLWTHSLITQMLKRDPGRNLDKLNHLKMIIILGSGVAKDSQQVFFPHLVSYGKLIDALHLKEKNPDAKILISGGDPWKKGVSEAEIYKNFLLDFQSINAQDIILEDRSRNTYENISNIYEIFDSVQTQIPHEDIVCLTNQYHVHRVRRILHIFDLDRIKVLSCSPVQKNENRLVFHSQHIMLSQLVLTEFFGYWRTELYELLGLNTTNRLKKAKEFSVNI